MLRAYGQTFMQSLHMVQVPKVQILVDVIAEFISQVSRVGS